MNGQMETDDGIYESICYRIGIGTGHSVASWLIKLILGKE